MLEDGETMSATPQISAVETPRIWIFSVEDFEGNEIYLAADGHAIEESEAKGVPFIGTLSESAVEAELRADRWEARYENMAARVTHHSLGKQCLEMGKR